MLLLRVRYWAHAEEKQAHTLGLSEDALLYASADCSVEQGVKHCVDSRDGVVGADILLESGTAGKVSARLR